MDQYLYSLYIPFLGGWTSIYQLFWGSLGTRVLTHPHILRLSRLSKELQQLSRAEAPNLVRTQSNHPSWSRWHSGLSIRCRDGPGCYLKGSFTAFFTRSGEVVLWEFWNSKHQSKPGNHRFNSCWSWMQSVCNAPWNPTLLACVRH